MNGAKVPRITLRQERLLAMQRRRRLQDCISDMITDFAGSMQFVYLHVVWFAVWTIGNLLWWRWKPWPPSSASTFNQVHSTAEARIKQAKARASDNGDRQATPA